MKYRKLIIVLIFLFSSFASFAEELSFEEGVLLIGLKEELDGLPQDVYLVVNYYQGEIVGSVIPGVFKVKFPQDIDIEAVKGEIEAVESVAYVELNYRFKVKAESVTPNDPGFIWQWGLIKVKLPQAWVDEKGSANVKVAIIDTGCDINHPDIKSRIDTVNSANFINPGSSVNDNSLEGHGTHIAGIIGAVSDNGTGIAGASWGPKLVILKVANMWGEIALDTLATAIYRAKNTEGVRVINMSLGGPFFSNVVHSAIKSAYAKGVVLVAAAGNEASNIKFIPAAYDEVIGVTATDSYDNPAYAFNQFDPMNGTNYNPANNEYYSIAAPGKDIYSSLPGNSYGYMNGTSMSCAFVSGIAALLISKDPELTPAEVKKIIEDNSDPIINEIQSKDIGKGRINAFKALSALDIGEPPVSEHVEAIAWVGKKGDKKIEVKKGSAVNFYGDESTAPEGKTLQYLWVFADSLNPFSRDKNPTHTYNISKEYKVTLIALTESQLDTDKVTVVVKKDTTTSSVNAVAWVGEKGKKEIEVSTGATVKFYGDESTPQSIEYFWVFGDSVNPYSFQANPTHQYSKSGVYSVKLVILTARDLDIAEVKVTVR